MDMKQEELQQTVELFLKEAERNLVGVYLHGSMAMGCYNPVITSYSIHYTKLYESFYAGCSKALA